MRSFLSMKAMRLFLAASVSIWMAGACLFGCSNIAMAHEADDSAQAIVAGETGESCHAARSHDCCGTKKKPKKQIARNSQQPPAGTSFVPASRGMMRDCPLAVNAT